MLAENPRLPLSTITSNIDLRTGEHEVKARIDCLLVQRRKLVDLN